MRALIGTDDVGQLGLTRTYGDTAASHPVWEGGGAFIDMTKMTNE